MSDDRQPDHAHAPKRSPVGPECEACGSATILKTFGPHPTLPGQEIRTYVCPNCKREEMVSAPQP
jgi:DNA-directed RNA polymerase subunit RPC12/RpoP